MKGTLSASSSSRLRHTHKPPSLLPGACSVSAFPEKSEKTKVCCTAEGWCCIFIGCRHASLLGLSDILKHFRLQNDGKPRYSVSKTWSETGSDIFWSSRCSIELDEIRKSFIFRQPHFPDGLEQPQNTRSGCSTCRESDVRFS